MGISACIGTQTCGTPLSLNYDQGYDPKSRGHYFCSATLHPGSHPIRGIRLRVSKRGIAEALERQRLQSQGIGKASANYKLERASGNLPRIKGKEHRIWIWKQSTDKWRDDYGWPVQLRSRKWAGSWICLSRQLYPERRQFNRREPLILSLVYILEHELLYYFDQVFRNFEILTHRGDR